MIYHAVTRRGDSEDAPNENRMREILAELGEQNLEHPNTSLTHQSGWTLSVFQSGLVVWKNMQLPGEPRHQVELSPEKVLELWLKLSRGEIEAIEEEPWHPGQSPPLTPEEQAELARQAEAATLASFRIFYDRLGPERPEVPCHHPACKRGAIVNSTFCRVHHFEMIYQRACPFQD